MHALKSIRMRPSRHGMLSTAGRRAMHVSTIECQHIAMSSLLQQNYMGEKVAGLYSEI